jgi:rSAM/selenodomain-associated transferase 2
MSEALDALHAGPLVLGPASDGGYYLIGLTQDAPELFADMPWGTGEVLERTTARAEAVGLEPALLDTLDDVDRPDDLPIWERWAAGQRGTKVSVIIPTLNEAADLPDTLDSVSGCPVHEVIVADGGSTDETVAIARSYGARVAETSPSRAGQMNAGATVATGDVLLFLHGDTRLPEDYTFHMLRGLSARGVVAGAFGFKVDAPNPGLRLVEWVTGLRSRYLQMPYGDQAIFVWADMFRQVGGYPEQPIMEDFVLVRRLRRRGRVVTLDVPAITSGRRWRQLGVLRTTLINQLMVVGHALGVSPECLARWYGRRRG